MLKIVDCGLRKAEDLKLWRLCSRSRPLSVLAQGNTVLIGDAAHPMLPRKNKSFHSRFETYHYAFLDQGQGGGMAIEDGAALGVLLSNIKSKDEIPARLQLFQELRIDRVSAMVIFSSVGQDESARIAHLAKQYVKGPLPRKFMIFLALESDGILTPWTETPEDYHVHNFTPNIIRDAMEILEKHRERLKTTDQAVNGSE